MTNIESLPGAEAENLLSYKATAIPEEDLYLPGSDFIERAMMSSDRSPAVLRNWQAMTGHGRPTTRSILPFTRSPTAACDTGCLFIGYGNGRLRTVN